MKTKIGIPGRAGDVPRRIRRHARLRDAESPTNAGADYYADLLPNVVSGTVTIAPKLRWPDPTSPGAARWSRRVSIQVITFVTGNGDLSTTNQVDNAVLEADTAQIIP